MAHGVETLQQTSKKGVVRTSTDLASAICRPNNESAMIPTEGAESQFMRANSNAVARGGGLRLYKRQRTPSSVMQMQHAFCRTSKRWYRVSVQSTRLLTQLCFQQTKRVRYSVKSHCHHCATAAAAGRLTLNRCACDLQLLMWRLLQKKQPIIGFFAATQIHAIAARYYR